jgi:hypothetical protein
MKIQTFAKALNHTKKYKSFINGFYYIKWNLSRQKKTKEALFTNGESELILMDCKCVDADERKNKTDGAKNECLLFSHIVVQSSRLVAMM